MLAMVLLLQPLGGLSTCAATASAESTVVQGVLNGEGLWLTEIYSYDETRNAARAANKNYDAITLFTASDGSAPELMEFIELVSTHEGTIDLNDTYEITYNGTALTVTDMDGSDEIRISKGQCVVIWNYRADLGVKDAQGNALSEDHFRSAMKVPEDAIVLKTECGGGWDNNSAAFSVNRRTDSQPVSQYTAVFDQGVQKGASLELRVPDRGSTMAVYHKYSIPSAGSYDISSGVNTKCQLNGLLYGEDYTETPEGVFVTEIKAEDIDRTDTYGTAAGQDLMEYVEIYNTTDATVDLNTEYRVKYFVRETYRENLILYNSTDLTSTEGCTVEPGGTAILWCYRINNVTYDTFPTEQEFRDTYGIADDVPVYFFTVKSQGNDLQDNRRGIEVYKINDDETQTLVSSFGYNVDDAADSGTNAIHLKPNNGRAQMLLFSSYGIWPGTFKTNQVTFDDDGTRLTVIPDDNDTDYTDTVTVPGTITQGEELRVLFRCLPGTDNDGSVSPLIRNKTTLYYRTLTDGEWSAWTEKAEETNTGTAYLRVPNHYEAIVSAYELYAADAVQFYIKAYNRYRGTCSDVYEVQIQKLSQVDGIRTNLSEGEHVSGTVAITANDGSGNQDLTLTLDGTTYTAGQLTPMLEDGGYLTFEMSGRAKAGMHALTTADDSATLIKRLSYWYDLVQDGQAVKLDSSLFQRTTDADGNVTYDVTVRFWAGTPATYLYDTAYVGSTDTEYYTNTDPYTLHDIALRVNDNTYTATGIVNRKGVALEANADGDYNIGADSTGKRSWPHARVDVSFSIPETDVPALGLELDTTKLADGEHTLVVASGTDTKTVHFTVDNTAPAISAGVSDGETLTGSITLAPTVTDDSAVTTAVILDGEEIAVPYSASAWELGKGEHTLEVYATDRAGNAAESAVTFNVDYADITAGDGTAADITGESATLTLTVDSAAGAEAVFYEAEKLENIEAESVTDSDVPYLKYTIDAGDAADTDEIAVNWTGAFEAKDGYAVKMYVRNTAAQLEAARWDLIGETDAEGRIDGTFLAENHVEDGKATVIVQYLRDSATPDVDAKTDSVSDWDGNSRPENYDFCFVLQADPQYYTEKYESTGIYSTMNQWIVDNADEWKIKYLMNVGDLIDDLDMTYQWEIADEAMKIFDDAGLPYGVLAGNHDVGESLAASENYCAYFGEDRFASQTTYGGSYQDNLGHYDLISQNGEDFIIVYMSWVVYQEEIEWINSVLAEHQDRKAILCFHAYTVPRIATTASRIDYFGDLVERTVVAQNPNVFAVLNGHYYGSAYYVSQYDDTGDGTNDRTVYHICKDYQAGTNGGNGYLDFLYFDIDGGKIYMNSYSPITDDFNHFDVENATVSINNTTGYLEQAANCDVIKELSADTPDGEGGDYYNAFILDQTFDPVVQTVTGSGFSAYLCENEPLGAAEVDASTGTAQIRAEGLTGGETYSWYAVVRNEETAQVRTGFYAFTTPEAVMFHSNVPGAEDTVFRAYYLDSEDDSQLTLNSSGKVTAFYDIPALSGQDSGRYIFKGWYLDPDNDDDSRPIKWNTVYTTSVNIYAHWIEVEDVAREDDGKSFDADSYTGFGVLGAEIREASGTTVSGLRFLAVMSESVYSQLGVLSTKNSSAMEYGFVLVKTAIADRYAKLYGDGYVLQYKGSNVNGVSTSSKYSYVTNVKCSSSNHYSGENYRLYSAVVTYKNLSGAALESAHAAPYTVRAYLRYYDTNGLLRTCYGDYTGSGAKYGGFSISYSEAASQ